MNNLNKLNIDLFKELEQKNKLQNKLIAYSLVFLLFNCTIFIWGISLSKKINLVQLTQKELTQQKMYLQKTLKDIQNKETYLSRYNKLKENYWHEKIVNLQINSPKELTISEINLLDQKNLNLRGETKELQQINQYINNIQLKLGLKITLKQVQLENEKYNFEIELLGR